MPAINAVKLPNEVGFVEGAFMEPITVALHGLLSWILREAQMLLL